MVSLGILEGFLQGFLEGYYKGTIRVGLGFIGFRV